MFGTTTGDSQVVEGRLGREARWSPRGDLLAFDGPGVSIFDARSGVTRMLGTDEGAALAWAPDGHAVAYVVYLPSSPFNTAAAAAGDLRVVTTAGKVRTIVAATVWRRANDDAHLDAPGGQDAVRATGGETCRPHATGPIQRLAADGTTVGLAHQSRDDIRRRRLASTDRGGERFRDYWAERGGGG